jgi:hypothetical protein
MKAPTARSSDAGLPEADGVLRHRHTRSPSTRSAATRSRPTSAVSAGPAGGRGWSRTCWLPLLEYVSIRLRDDPFHPNPDVLWRDETNTSRHNGQEAATIFARPHKCGL